MYLSYKTIALLFYVHLLGVEACFVQPGKWIPLPNVPVPPVPVTLAPAPVPGTCPILACCVHQCAVATDTCINRRCSSALPVPPTAPAATACTGLIPLSAACTRLGCTATTCGNACNGATALHCVASM